MARINRKDAEAFIAMNSQTAQQACSRMTVTKDQLKERVTLVRLAREAIPSDGLRRELYVVKDLMSRKGYDMPNRIGVGPLDLGIAFGVNLDQVVEVIDPEEL